jgi:hypothetical protein
MTRTHVDIHQNMSFRSPFNLHAISIFSIFFFKFFEASSLSVPKQRFWLGLPQFPYPISGFGGNLARTRRLAKAGLGLLPEEAFMGIFRGPGDMCLHSENNEDLARHHRGMA